MSAVRRQGVIDDHGSLTAYRDYVIRGRDQCALVIDVAREHQPEPGPLHVMELMLADWECDLRWVDAELAREAA